MMNYKATSKKGEKLPTEQDSSFLKVGKKKKTSMTISYIVYDAKIKVIVLEQTFLIAKRHFDPKEYSRRSKSII